MCMLGQFYLEVGGLNYSAKLDLLKNDGEGLKTVTMKRSHCENLII